MILILLCHRKEPVTQPTCLKNRHNLLRPPLLLSRKRMLATRAGGLSFRRGFYCMPHLVTIEFVLIRPQVNFPRTASLVVLTHGLH